MVTLASELGEEDADARLILQSRAGNETIVLLATRNDYFRELEEAKRIEKYVKQRNVSQLPESIRRIIQAKQAEAKEHEKCATGLLKEAILQGTFYISGERVQIRRASVQEALDEAMARLVESVYSKLNYVDSFVQNDGDIQKILDGASVQEALPGMAAPNVRALDEIRQYMEIRSRQHMTVTMAELQKRYQAAPYGWREIDIAALMATLVRGQRLQLVCDGVTLKPGERRMLDCLRKRAETERTVVQQKIAVSEPLLRAARKLGAELFGTMDLQADEENLCGQLLALLMDAKRKNDAVAGMYTGEHAYPGRQVVERGAQVFGDILTRKGDNTAFLEAFTKAEDDLLDWSEDFQEVSFFFANQKKIYDAAWQLCERVQRERTYFADEPEALEAVADKAIAMKIGARGLRSVMEGVMTDVMYTVPSDTTASKIIITAQAVTEGAAPIVEHRAQ